MYSLASSETRTQTGSERQSQAAGSESQNGVGEMRKYDFSKPEDYVRYVRERVRVSGIFINEVMHREGVSNPRPDRYICAARSHEKRLNIIIVLSNLPFIANE